MPDKNEIVSGSDFRMSYQTFYKRIGQLANSLKTKGIIENMRVGVMDWDTHRYLECFFAIPMMGATLQTINVRLSAAQVLYTINHGGPDVIIVHEDFMPLVEEIKSNFNRDITLIPIGNGEGYEDWISESSSTYDFSDFDENKTATLFYTTGTTGNPKGVSYSHRQLVLHTLGLVAGFSTYSGDVGLHRDDVYMPLTPLFHVHGWGFPYAATMLGVHQVYPGRYTPETILQLISNEGVTFSHCVPTIMSMILDGPNCSQTDLSKWKVIIGGAALPSSLQECAKSEGISLHAAYGMSETCPFLSVADLHSDNPKVQAQSGFAGPLVDLRVVSPDMEDVPHDGESTGEVVVRAPWLTKGYLKNAEASDALWAGGYLHTGDVGFLRQDGSLQITDRLKDVIKTGGEWISSLSLENIASSSCNHIEAVAAIGRPDEKWGERPVLVVQVSPESDQKEVQKNIIDEFQSCLEKGEISKWAIPNDIIFVEKIPKTSVGKINKKVVREDFLKNLDLKS